MDDNRIVELYLTRNETAIALTTEKYGKRLRALAQNITEDAQTAEECENDTYIQAWNSIPPMNREIISLPFWPGSPATFP